MKDRSMTPRTYFRMEGTRAGNCKSSKDLIVHKTKPSGKPDFWQFSAPARGSTLPICKAVRALWPVAKRKVPPVYMRRTPRVDCRDDELVFLLHIFMNNPG